VSQEVQVRDEDIRSLVLTQCWNQRKQFANLLPADVDADAFAGLAAAALWRDPLLAVAALNSPDSLLISLREAARLGHEPGTEMYYLTVRGNKVLGIEGYQGVIDRMYRAGGVVAVHCDVITFDEDSAGAFVRHDPDPPSHQRSLARDLSVANLAGVYAYAILEGGACSQVVVMGRNEVMNHRAMAGKPGSENKNVWDGPFGLSMWKKTPVDELRKWVPTSASYRKERNRVDAEFARQQQAQPAQKPAEPPVPPDPHSAIGPGADEPLGVPAGTP
jgi:recombination protein RecT